MAPQSDPSISKGGNIKNADPTLESARKNRAKHSKIIAKMSVRTRSGLSIITITSGTKTSILMRPGGGPDRNLMEPYVLNDLGKLIASAKEKLDWLIQHKQ